MNFRNFKIQNKKCNFSLKEILLPINDVNIYIFNNCIELKNKYNTISIVGGSLQIENCKIVLCQKYPIGIFYEVVDSKINYFCSFGSVEFNFDENIISEFSSEMNKYFLNMSGINIYKNYDICSLNKDGLIQLKENIDEHVATMINISSGILYN